MKKIKSQLDSDKYWVDLIQTIKIKKIPVEYLSELTIVFDNNKVWSVDLHPNLTSEQYRKLEHNIDHILSTYDTSIVNVKHTIDIKKIKKDITSSTKKLLRNTK